MINSSVECSYSHSRAWLQTGSIPNTFEQLAQVFLTQYTSCQEYKRASNHLFTVKMKAEEPVKKYLTRFQTERSKVPACNDDVTAAAFVNGCASTISSMNHW